MVVLASALRILAKDQKLLSRLSNAAACDYASLTNPSLALRLWKILTTQESNTDLNLKPRDPYLKGAYITAKAPFVSASLE